MDTTAEKADKELQINKGLEEVHNCVRKLDDSQKNNSQTDSEAEATYQRLNELYDASSEDVRYTIAYEISAFPSDQSRFLLERILRSDESALVRHEAASSLGDVGNKTHIPLLTQILLNDKSWLVRHEAAMALHSIGDETTLPPLEQGLKDDSPEVVVSCRVAMNGIKHRLNLKLQDN